LDRLARSVPDARKIADVLQAHGMKLALGTSLCDPSDPMCKMFFNVLATFAEFEGDLIRLPTREGMTIARAKGNCGENSQNFLINSRKNCAVCTKWESTQSVTLLNCFQCHDQRFTVPFPVTSNKFLLVLSGILNLK
jgi:hypothetical protein